MSPAAFSANLVKCIKNDWELDGKGFSRLSPLLAKMSSSAFGAEFQMEFLKAELLKDPRSSFQTITDAYLTLVKDAKKKRKEGDPWPVIIIDEANALMEWKDTDTLSALLKFFVYLTKQEQLAHVILATSDTFLTQWLESGAPTSCRCGAVQYSNCLSCGHRPHQTPVPRHFRGWQLNPRRGAHILLRLCHALS